MSDIEKSPARPPASVSDPFSAFRGEMDRVFQSFFGPHLSAPRSGAVSQEGAVVPTVDVTENEASLVIAAELPGMSEEEIDVAINGDLLTISGEKKIEKSTEEDDVHIVERRYGSVRRSFRLPDTVDTEHAKAIFENGVLKIILPKKPEIAAQSRKIKIGAA